jgi:hypothetical protein
LHHPYGLAFDSSYNLIVVDADMKSPKIFTFNRKTGRVLNEKHYDPISNKHSNSEMIERKFNLQETIPFSSSKIRFVCCKNDHLYASDLGRSLIFKTDLNGETELVFGKHGKSIGELNEPSGIHIENDCQSILVGDSKNDRLSVRNYNYFF